MSDKIKSLLFDFFQIGSIVFLVLTGSVISSHPILIFLQFIALCILLESVWEMRRTKYYRIPDVGKQNELVKRGIYAFVRNPMYLSQLLFGSTLIIHAYSLPRLAAFLILFINFVFKIQYEEHLLQENFTEFAEYKKRSWRLIPFIY